MKLALAIAFLLVVSSAAQAETNQERVRRWFTRPAPVALPPENPAVVKAPAQRTASTPQNITQNITAPVKQARPKAKTKAKTKAKAKTVAPTINVNDPDYISCADARRGVTMSCFELVAYSGVYNRYSEKKKANARACLRAAEQRRIAACFPKQ